jgi:hypothetical protein
MKVSATRPSTNSSGFELESQRMKKEIKISAHMSQAWTQISTNRLGLEIQSQKIKVKNQNFNLYKPILRL